MKYDLVYVPDENGDFAVEFMPDEIAAFNQRVCEAKQLKDVFVFTKEELDKRDKALVSEILKIYDGLSHADKCTVWPPAGSGAGTGLYNMSYEDLAEKVLKKIIQI
jgi:hypothetical protein